jgi:membrane protein YdbS with pleckstrin-like domain
MDFANKMISPLELPSIAEVTFHPLEKNYLLVKRISFFITIGILLVLAVLLFYILEEIQDPFIISMAIMLFILFSILSYVSTSLSFKYSGYALREKDLLFRSGWIIRRVRIVMCSRIQHVSIQSGPMERKFGLSSVSIFTAGSSEADFTIKGITEQTAQRIKEGVNSEVNGNLNTSL